METPTHSTSSRFFGHLLLAGFFLLGLLAPGQLGAAELKEGRVTQVIKDVKLLPEQAAPRPAAVNDKVQGGTAVRTGADSRTELTFADLTIARLGANTIFSVNEGSRTIDLGGGAILVRVPKNSGGAKISTAAVTAAITGTTMMAEYHKDLFKFIMLEGTAQICRVGAAGDCVEIQTGQMLQGRPGEPLGQPVTVDLRALVSSSKLLEGFGPLGSEDLIARAIADQEAGRVFVANAVRPDATGLEERDQRAATSTPSPSPTPQETPTPRPSVTPSPTPSPTATPTPSPSASPTPSPTASPTPSPTASPTPSPTASPTPSPTPQPTPDKFGTPPVITSTNLSVIDGGTTIQTDPSITRNGETGYGRIYRNFSQDGAASAWLFGSTSSFDATSHFDQIIAASAPFAAFKFSDLTILGDPTIVTANGGATSLALIGVNGIGAGTILNRLNLAGPNVLHFTGINSLLLATQSGSIDLKSDIAFADLNTLLLYARGANSDLNLGSMISNVITLGIAAENDINITNDLSVTSVTAHSGGDFNVSGNGAVHGQAFDIFAGGDLNFELARFPAGSSGVTSVHLDANSAVNIIAGNDSSLFEAALSVDVSGATISLTSDNGYPVVLNFNPSATLTRFSAGLGGIQAHDIGFVAPNLQLLSDGNIDIFRADSLAGSITAGGFLHTASDLTIGQLTSGAEIAVGGNLFAANIIAGTSISAQKITAFGGSISAGSDITSNSSIELQQNPPGTFGNITAGGNISANGGIFTPGTPAVVSAEGSISAHAILTGAVVAGTDITIDNSAGVFGFGIIANSVTANGGQAPFSAGLLTLINVATINSNGGSFSDHDGATPNDFVLQVGSITSTGPTFPIVSSNGGDANPDFADSNPGNGGSIFLGINTSGLTIGDGANLDSVVANGGAYNSGGPLGGGNGGSILMGVSGDVTVSLPYNEGPAISATSGIVSNVGSQFAGSGGVVDIAASGAFNIMGTIKVSSDDAAEFGTTGAGRESAAGGTIALRSGLTIGTGTGITITADGQLLSRLSLDAYNAGGTTGSIDLSTMGADIVVNGTVRADFGTVTMEQNDIPRMRPNGGLDTPAITLDGGTVQSATFNINGSGNLLIGPNLGTAINIFGGTWDVAHDITINAANTSFAYAFALDATAGHAINFNGGNANVPATLTLALSGSTTFTAGAGGINAPFVDILYAGAELNLNSSAGITANSIKFTDYYARGTVNAAGAISITGDLFQGVVTAGSNINVGGGVSVSTMAAGTTISVGQDISAGDLTAGGDITAGTTRVQNITAPQGLLNVAGGIYPSVFSTDPQFPDQGAMAPHVYTVDSIISPNGIDFSGNQFNGIRGYTSGGLLTLNVNSITFDYGSVGGATFNGADVNGFFGGVSPTVPGDGGIFTVNATGDITVNDPITASTGLTNAAGNLGGAGGTVTLDSSSGTITANSTIQVSHADPTPGPSRRSAVGGNIRLTSGKSGTASNRAVAIDVGNSGQLLSLLAAAPTPRPGGKIVIQATGANSDLNVGGKVRADGGLVDIRHTGTAGDVNLNGGSDNFLSVAADVIKVAALGDNGVLRVGGGTLSADTTLQLYATGFNGEVRFIGNVSLNGNATKSIAGNSVSINPGVLVSIGGPAASVYVNSTNGVPNAHYTGFGGSGTSSDSGTFGGSGANPPQPLDQAPALDPPSGRPASVSQPSGASQSAGGLRH